MSKAAVVPSVMFVAEALFGMSWLPEVTDCRTAALTGIGARHAASASTSTTDRRPPGLSKPMSDEGLWQGVCHAGGGLAGQVGHDQQRA
jgi:hypothetical protein